MLLIAVSRGDAAVVGPVNGRLSGEPVPRSAGFRPLGRPLATEPSARLRLVARAASCGGGTFPLGGENRSAGAGELMIVFAQAEGFQKRIKFKGVTFSRFRHSSQ